MNREELIEELYKRKGVFVNHITRFISGPEVEDVFQEGVLKFYLKYNNCENWMGWATTTMKRAAIDRLRRDQKVSFVDQNHLENSPCPAEDRIKDKEEFEHRYEQILKGIKTLSNERQQLLHFQYFDGLSIKEIANKVGKSEEAVQKALNRARLAIKEIVRKN